MSSCFMEKICYQQLSLSIVSHSASVALETLRVRSKLAESMMGRRPTPAVCSIVGRAALKLFAPKIATKTDTDSPQARP